MTSSTRLKDEEAKRAEARAAAAEEAEQSLRSAVEDIRGEFEVRFSYRPRRPPLANRPTGLGAKDAGDLD